MKFYVDENLPASLAKTFQQLIGGGHRFYDFKTSNMQGTLDLELLDYLGTMEYGAIITKDARQLEDQEERDALRRNGLHWIGVTSSGLQGRAEIRGVIGTLMGGLPTILREWKDVPTAYRLEVHPSAWGPPVTFTI